MHEKIQKKAVILPERESLKKGRDKVNQKEQILKVQKRARLQGKAR